MATVVIKEPNRKEEILKMIHAILDDIALSDDTERSIEEMVEKGLRRVESDRLDRARTLEAKENFKELAKSLRKHALDNHLLIIYQENLEIVLWTLCPLYPIC